MPPQMMSRTILIFTLVTGIIQSLAKDKPNTFWSKRAGKPKLSGPIKEDSERSKNLDQYINFPFTELIRKLKIQRDSYVLTKSKYDAILPLYRMLVSNLLRHH